jgi:hypothetical protein
MNDEPTEIRIAAARMHVLEAALQSVADSSRPDHGPLAHLDTPIPCQAGPGGGTLIDEPDPCPDPADWSLEIHNCSKPGHDIFWGCSHHAAIAVFAFDGAIHANDGYLPCGHFMASVWHALALERL